MQQMETNEQHIRTYSKERFEKYLTVDFMLDNYFDFPSTLAKCKTCPGFAMTWSCPEFSFDPRDYWKNFSRFHFIVDKVFNDGTSTPDEAQERLFYEKSIFDDEMLALEAACPGSRALAAQECARCKKCLRLYNKPCAHPESMRYALESLGMIAVNMVKDQFGFDILWSDGVSVPEYYLLVGGVLEK